MPIVTTIAIIASAIVIVAIVIVTITITVTRVLPLTSINIDASDEQMRGPRHLAAFITIASADQDSPLIIANKRISAVAPMLAWVVATAADNHINCQWCSPSLTG